MLTSVCNMPNTTADTITATIKGVLDETSLNLHRCRGQRYDGASSMAGSSQGVAHQIFDEEPRALFTHCDGYSLMCDTLKS